MTAALLSTKLHVPSTRPALVPRPRVTERLSMGMAGKLTLITAPAGFGKTTAVSAWLDPHAEAETLYPFVLRPRQVAWVSLDAADNDPRRFWTYVIAALDSVSPGLGETALPLLNTEQPVMEAVLTTLINGLGGHGPRVVLVLDDYHLIETPAIHDALHFLLIHLPARVHLVIATRREPPLPLARLRVRGQLTELRVADLRFSSDEAAHFLNDVMRLSLHPREIAALEARTEGWIAGLQLAALAVRNRPHTAGMIEAFSGSNRYITEYLVEEVFTREAAHIQAFLLQTSILDRMCGPLCDAILGISDPAATDATVATPSGRGTYSQLLLDDLERTNLFLAPLDDEPGWYRYHYLFGDVLRERLLTGALDADVAVLHQRASAWYAAHGFPSEAITHAIAGRDWERAAALLSEHRVELGRREPLQRVSGWIAQLPPALIHAHPDLQHSVPAFADSTHTPSIDALSARELEILQLVAAGASNRDVADQLIVTLGTVKKHLNNIFSKLQVESRTQAVAQARRLGLL